MPGWVDNQEPVRSHALCKKIGLPLPALLDAASGTEATLKVEKLEGANGFEVCYSLEKIRVKGSALDHE